MTTQYLRQPNGQLLASITTRNDGCQMISTPNGQPLAYYQPANNCTYEMNGRLIGHGNLLAIVLKK